MSQPGSTSSVRSSVASPSSRLDAYFEVTRRGSTIGREVRGGLVTFVTMAYIIVLNPLIIGTAADVTGARLGIGPVAAATALVAGVMTILMGVVGRFPLAVAAGLGINGVVAFSFAPQMSWPDAMGLVVAEGLLITVLVLTGFRTAVFNAVPPPLKAAIGVGIGLFITVIGFVDAGLVRPGVPLVSFGVGGQLAGWPILVFVVGLLLTALLVARRVRGAILIGIAVSTALAIVVEAVAHVGPQTDRTGKVVNPTGWGLNVPRLPDSVVARPDLGLLGHFSLGGAFAQIGVIAAGLAVFSLMLSDFFDTMGTVVGIAGEAGLADESGSVPHLEGILLVDSLAAVAGGAASTSSNTSYIESAAGVGEGARTGLASVVTGALFLLAVFLSPLVAVIPYEAATPALVVVGFLMMTQIRAIDFTDYSVAIPAFLTIVLMPFTYSITNGIGAGFVSYVLIQAATGRARAVKPLMWVVAGLFVVYFASHPIRVALGL
jgi:AGZA family xanthine/uracil permease-like MFS transporter